MGAPGAWTAYRETWPGFFEWQRSGAVFEIVSLEVTAGARGTPSRMPPALRQPDELAARPARRLRLTLGLRKEGGRWVVAHEHHSFADMSRVDAERSS